ncbi:SPS-sensor serine protease component SSY5 [Nakaseomyces bracarensis]|uniref:SPS-sensor serine protease component SSY5 n=1 Tax=Nakaseomyces bracarensis TaxID=273131 RepID=A0ABR4NQQ5_9SACH
MVKRLFGFNKKNQRRESSPEEGPQDDQSSHEKKPQDDVSMQGTSVQSSSIFSRGKRSYNSGESSVRSSTRGKSTSSSDYNDIGKPLRIIDSSRYSHLGTVEEEETSVSEESTPFETPGAVSVKNESKDDIHHNTPDYTLYKEIRDLDNNLLDLMADIHQNVTNISRAVICAIEYFKNFQVDESQKRYMNTVKTTSCPSLRSISKTVLHFLDNLLISDAYSNSRSILLRRYLCFLKKLGVQISNDSDNSSFLLPTLSIFPIDDSCKLPNKDKIFDIIDELAKTDPKLLSEDEGSFIAPVMRGLGKDSAIISVIFGLPNIRPEHHELIKDLYGLFPDIHFYCIQDSIRPAATTAILPEIDNHRNMENMDDNTFKFTPPYKTTESNKAPPISLSLSTQNSVKTSGTLGGYIFPQVEKNNKKLSKFAGSTFAITCAHVVLAESQDYPEVAVPSKVLQRSYFKTLLDESSRYPKGSKEQKAFLEEARNVEKNMKYQNENKFGQVVWGERSIINQRLSDFAIIKVNESWNCQNYLGNNLENIPDPTLKFDNVYVKKKIMKVSPGTKVFKIGAATGYTSGQVNAAKLIYWADGKLQSSEFVVSSPQPLFASGGDSGAWILTKLDDRVGLGVVGMLHSYDGERKQFGLFSPIGDILERLHAVTGIQWDIDYNEHV